MSSKLKTSSSQPSRRRRDSSEDFGAGSLGSICGSAVGSSVEGQSHGDKKKLAADPSSSAVGVVASLAVQEVKPASSAASKASTNASPLTGRRPFRKRQDSIDLALAMDDEHSLNLSKDDSTILPTIDALPSMDLLPAMDASTTSPLVRARSNTLDHLDALGEEAGVAAARIKVNKRKRKGSEGQESKGSDNSSGHVTLTSDSHRILLQAFMGDGTESLVDSKAAEQSEAMEFRRERIGSLSRRDRLGSFDLRERLGSFDARDRIGGFDVRDRLDNLDTRERGGSFEGIRRRERLESWGGMSDLSIPVPDSSGTDSLMGNGTETAAALAATIYTSLANDLTAAVNGDENGSVSSFLVSDDVVPSKISLNRDRLNSVASEASEPSSQIQIQAESEFPSDIQKIVKAAMASVGDQLAAVANATIEVTKDLEDHSEISSTASPLIGAASDTASKAGSVTGRPRSSSLSQSINICVDADAIAAAVSAAEAFAIGIEVGSVATKTSAATAVGSSSSVSSRKKRRKLPTHKKKSEKQSSTQEKPSPKRPLHELPPIPKSKMDERHMAIIRQKARAAAGYVPPLPSPTDQPPLPPKKKTKIEIPSTPSVKKPPEVYQTPKISNTSIKPSMSTPYTPALSTPGSSVKTPASKGQSSQKWDSMFDCLVQFITERRTVECKGMSDEEQNKWSWDGNVPTTFKTKDGKALGRWVNNQRSAKSKGVLKDDREKRLVNAGLKWSVLASNSWNEMLEELRIYVNDQTKAGRKWDGNVPTNYRIKTKIGGKDDEDKNLGRWVNRQRSLYQAGKLRKDRQQALERVGLKWSMLATTSWESMFDTLCVYVTSKTKDDAEWDGNVPANYRTTDNPPRALGRWINRQRSAYGKDKLKPEYIEKLNKIGLKWSVHERRPVVASPEPAVTPSAMDVSATPITITSTASAELKKLSKDTVGTAAKPAEPRATAKPSAPPQVPKPSAAPAPERVSAPTPSLVSSSTTVKTADPKAPEPIESSPAPKPAATPTSTSVAISVQKPSQITSTATAKSTGSTATTKTSAIAPEPEPPAAPTSASKPPTVSNPAPKAPDAPTTGSKPPAASNPAPKPLTTNATSPSPEPPAAPTPSSKPPVTPTLAPKPPAPPSPAPKPPATSATIPAPEPPPAPTPSPNPPVAPAPASKPPAESNPAPKPPAKPTITSAAIDDPKPSQVATSATTNPSNPTVTAKPSSQTQSPKPPLAKGEESATKEDGDNDESKTTKKDSDGLANPA